MFSFLFFFLVGVIKPVKKMLVYVCLFIFLYKLDIGILDLNS